MPTYIDIQDVELFSLKWLAHRGAQKHFIWIMVKM